MSEDLTQNLPKSDSETLHLILTSTQNLEARFGKLESRVEDIDSRLGGLGQRLGGLGQKVEERLPDMRPIWHKIDSRLRALETTVEQRLHDTRPIWHKVVADIAQVQAGQQRLEKGVSDLNITVGELSRYQMVINDVIRKIHLDSHNIDQRLHTLELNRNQQNSST
jgi:DNA repair ATPase RecN